MQTHATRNEKLLHDAIVSGRSHRLLGAGASVAATARSSGAAGITGSPGVPGRTRTRATIRVPIAITQTSPELARR